jgi:hypothetical protein
VDPLLLLLDPLLQDPPLLESPAKVQSPPGHTLQNPLRADATSAKCTAISCHSRVR